MGYIIGTVSVDVKNKKLTGRLASSNLYPKTYDKVENKYDEDKEFLERMWDLIASYDGGSTKLHKCKTKYALDKTLDYGYKNLYTKNTQDKDDHDYGIWGLHLTYPEGISKQLVKYFLEKLKEPKPKERYMLKVQGRDDYIKKMTTRRMHLTNKHNAKVLDAYDVENHKEYASMNGLEFITI